MTAKKPSASKVNSFDARLTQLTQIGCVKGVCASPLKGGGDHLTQTPALAAGRLPQMVHPLHLLRVGAHAATAAFRGLENLSRIDGPFPISVHPQGARP